MTGTFPRSTPRSAIGGATTASEPLARSYDPPVQGPVLLATDGRSATDATLRAARAFAERLGTSVEVVGVLEPFPSYLMAPEVHVVPPDVEEARRAAIRGAIAERLETLGGGAERWPVSVFYGEPARTIAAVARQHDSSLIVVGIGRHELRDRVLGGERALRAVRAADRPVVVVAPDVRGLPAAAVVGVDFSPASVRAARAALMLLADGGRLVLAHVRPKLDVPAAPGVPILDNPSFDALVERWHKEAEAEAARGFAAIREELRPYAAPCVTIETRTLTGEPCERLVGVASAVGADLIAVGTHGAGVVERFFLGSVATDVLRSAGRTVLVAPAPNPAESARLELRFRGTVELDRPADWPAALAAFSEGNAGRRVRLEVDDPDFGAQIQQSGYALLGVVYDVHDRRVELMMGDPADRTSHLTRTIARVADVAIYATPDGRDRALRVAAGHGQTLLTFLD